MPRVRAPASRSALPAVRATTQRRFGAAFSGSVPRWYHILPAVTLKNVLRYAVSTADGIEQPRFVPFEALLVKKDGRWLMVPSPLLQAQTVQIVRGGDTAGPLKRVALYRSWNASSRRPIRVVGTR